MTAAGGVSQRLGDFGREFRQAFRSINDVTGSMKHIRPLPMSLSTITFTGTLSSSSLPVDAMRLAAELAQEMDDPLEFSVDCDMTKPAKRQKNASTTTAAAARPAPQGGKRFRYQLPLKRNGKSLKLFHNGSVHATGCTSPLEFLDMMDALCVFMKDAGDVDAWLTDFDIQLINTLFVVTDPATCRPMTIAPASFLRHLGTATRADFDTERHPSVKIPLRIDDVKVATVCVFQTGSVSIMGAKRPSHLAAAFDMVCTALDACAAEVCVPDPKCTIRTTTAKHALTLVQGYPFNLFSCCQV